MDKLINKMFATNLIKAEQMHKVALAAERLCAGYWFGFNAASINQDPDKMASFYKESGHK